MKCPHCLSAVFEYSQLLELYEDTEGFWYIIEMLCPSCNKLILHLARSKENLYRLCHGESCILSYFEKQGAQINMIHPKSSSRPCPSEVPESIAQDFREACLVLADSPRHLPL